MTRDLTPFFAPRSIAVVGAGERATSSGGAIMQMLRRAGYGGRVVPVNPKGGTIFGYEAVTGIAAVDPPVDLAVIVIRPDAILDAAAECADRGIRNLLILPGGFAEAGATGVARNEALLKLAAARGLTIAGPNCAGLIHLDPGWRFAATFLRDLPPGADEERPCLHLPVRRARRGIHRQGQCARPAAHLGRVGRQCSASRRRGLSRLAGRAAGNRRGAALCRIDRGSRTLPRRRAPGCRRQAGDRPVRRQQRRRRSCGGRAYRGGRQRRRGHRGVRRLVRHRAGEEPAPPAAGRQGVRPFPAGHRQARADPVELGRAGRDLRRPRRGGRPRTRRAAAGHGRHPAPAASARGLGRQSDRPAGRRPGGSLRPRLRERR